MSIPTPHINAKLGDFAETVLMPGDPLRAKFVAENYLENAVLVNEVRGMLGYTGYYKGKRVSVMASGMGQPSIGIYSYELFNFYGVENIIRIGSCGSFDEDLHLKDLIIAEGACTNGNYINRMYLAGTFCPIADFSLLVKAVEEATKAGVKFKVGNILSSDTFYAEEGTDLSWQKMGVLGVEMEAAALYANAARMRKHALCICSVSDSFIYKDEIMSSYDRQTSFTKMIEIALEVAIRS
ncbi:MAG: purine-nucleoside phosphorylase [Clostridia bacterium]|nr:purine-nucleoside phosphorylase [Clostridia bacterium]